MIYAVTLFHVVLVLLAGAVGIVCASPMAKRHLAAWLRARAFYQENIREEKRQWNAAARQRYSDEMREYEREAGPVRVEEAA